MQSRRDRRGRRRRQQARECDPGVRLDQGERRRQQPRHHRAAHHSVRLGRHQHAQRRRVQLDPARGHRARHHHREHRPRQHRARHRRPPPVRQPVQRRPDHRRQQGEGGHRDGQVQRDPAACLVRRHREEHRRRQRHRDHHVAGAVDRVQLDQLAEARLAGPVRMRGPPDPPGRARDGEVQGAPDGPAGPPGRSRAVTRRPCGCHIRHSAPRTPALPSRRASRAGSAPARSREAHPPDRAPVTAASQPCPRIGPCMWASGVGGGSVRSAPPAVALVRAPLRDPAEWIAGGCARGRSGADVDAALRSAPPAPRTDRTDGSL